MKFHDQMPSCDMSTATTSEPSSGQSTQLDDDEITVVEGPASSSQPTAILSNELLQMEIANREAECERCHQNGNKAPQQDKPDGKNLDQTCLKLTIKWPGVFNGGQKVIHYYCIACDSFHANNSQTCTFDHFGKCPVCVTVNFLSFHSQHVLSA